MNSASTSFFMFTCHMVLSSFYFRFTDKDFNIIITILILGSRFAKMESSNKSFFGINCVVVFSIHDYHILYYVRHLPHIR